MSEDEIKICEKKVLNKLKHIYDKGGSRALNQEIKNTDYGSFTLNEIGYVLGLTRERVRQIEQSAIKKLKHPKIGRKLSNYMAYESFSDDYGDKDYQSYKQI